MKNKNHLLCLAIASLLGAATGFAQTTTPTTTTTTTTPTTTSGGTTTGTTTPTTTDDDKAVGRPTNVPPGPPANKPATPGNSRPTNTTPGTPPTTTGGDPTTSTGNPGKGTPHMVNEHASDTAKAIQATMLKFDAKRDALAAERKALIDKLQTAKTEDERKKILEELRTEQQTQADERRALGKEMRDELKKLRDQRKGGG